MLAGAWNRLMDFVDQSYLCMTETCHEMMMNDYQGRHRNRSSRVEIDKGVDSVHCVGLLSLASMAHFLKKFCKF